MTRPALRRLLAWTVTPLLGLTVFVRSRHRECGPGSRDVRSSRSTPRSTPGPVPGIRTSDHVQAAHGTHKWQTTERVVQVRTGPGDNIALGIDTTLYVPDNASRKHPQPAILMTHGFGLTKDSAEVVSTASFFAAHGYVVLTYTSSGFGASGGCVTLQSADYDVKSARQLIDQVLEPRKDVLRDRRGVVVGTIGGSYGGGIQLPLAAADRRIRTSIVGRTWNDLRYSLDPNNRVVPGDPTGLTHSLNEQGVFKQQWTSLFYALGNTQPANGDGGCPQAKQASGDPAEIAGAAGCPGYYLALCRDLRHADLDRRRRPGVAHAHRTCLGVDVHRQAQEAGPAGPGPERHAVQPQRRERHLPLPQEAPRAGGDDLELRRARRLHLPAGRVRGLRRHDAFGQARWTTAT